MTTNHNDFLNITFTQKQLKIINEVLVHKQSMSAVARKYNLSAHSVKETIETWKTRIEHQPLILTVEQVTEMVANDESVQVMELPLSIRVQRSLIRNYCDTLSQIYSIYKDEPHRFKMLQGLGAKGRDEVRQLLLKVYGDEQLLPTQDFGSDTLTEAEIVEKAKNKVNIHVSQLPISNTAKYKLCSAGITTLGEIIITYKKNDGDLTKISGIGIKMEQEIKQFLKKIVSLEKALS
ncbi:hypothetical protein AAXE64_28015 [Priestia megaterium]